MMEDKGPVFYPNSFLAYPDCASFLAAISPLPDQDQARLIAILVRAHIEIIAEPAMKDWIFAHASLIAKAAGLQEGGT